MSRPVRTCAMAACLAVALASEIPAEAGKPVTADWVAAHDYLTAIGQITQPASTEEQAVRNFWLVLGGPFDDNEEDDVDSLLSYALNGRRLRAAATLQQTYQTTALTIATRLMQCGSTASCPIAGQISQWQLSFSFPQTGSLMGSPGLMVMPVGDITSMDDTTAIFSIHHELGHGIYQFDALRKHVVERGLVPTLSWEPSFSTGDWAKLLDWTPPSPSATSQGTLQDAIDGHKAFIEIHKGNGSSSSKWFSWEKEYFADMIAATWMKVGGFHLQQVLQAMEHTLASEGWGQHPHPQYRKQRIAEIWDQL
jgi:hypothetical protein